MSGTALRNLKQLQADPAVFRRSLFVDTDMGPERLGEVLDDWQREDFAALDASWYRLLDPGRLDFGQVPTRAWLERPRGHSKTSDIAVMVSWVLFAARRPVRGIVAAADRDQAGLLRQAVETLLRSNRWLAEFLEMREGRVVNPHTGSSLQIISSDVGSSYGHLADFVICEELTHWSDRALWDSLFSTAGKRKHCLLLVVTNAGVRDSWQFELREGARTEPGWVFRRLDGPVASWITDKQLQEQARLLPSVAYRRLWLNEWSDGPGDALTEDVIRRALTLPGPQRAQDGFAYAAGLDLGISRDASALVVVGKSVGRVEHVLQEPLEPEPIGIEAARDLGFLPSRKKRQETVFHRGTGRLHVARVDVWKPSKGQQVDLEEIEHTIRALHAEFELQVVACDPYQAAYLMQRLRKVGLNCPDAAQTGMQLQYQAQAVLSAFNDDQIDLYREADLLADLKQLQIAERRAFGFRLVSPRRTETHGTRHGDTATALSLAAWASARLRTRAAEYPGSLVLSP